MNLYTVGCSFTHGHHAHGHRPYQSTVQGILVNQFDRHDFAWPWQLEDRFAMVINDALQGTGSGFAYRRLTRFLSLIGTDNLSDWIFVLQMSQPARREFMISGSPQIHYPDSQESDSDLYTEGAILLAPRHHDRVDSEVSWLEHDEFVDTALSTKQKHHAAGYYYLAEDAATQMFQHLRDQLAMMCLLESVQARYLVTGMMYADYHPDAIPDHYNLHNNRFLKSLVDLIPTHSLIPDYGHMLRDHAHTHDPCYHPNPLGHSVVAEKIWQQIQHRGWM